MGVEKKRFCALNSAAEAAAGYFKAFPTARQREILIQLGPHIYIRHTVMQELLVFLVHLFQEHQIATVYVVGSKPNQ